MSDNAIESSSKHRQPTISNRRRSHTRSRRSDALEAAQDTRPLPTDCLLYTSDAADE